MRLNTEDTRNAKLNEATENINKDTERLKEKT